MLAPMTLPPELQAAQARRELMATAQFAALVAHGMNNVLMPAAGNLDLLLAEGKLDAPSEELVAESLASLSDGEALADELACIARREPYSPEIMDVREVARNWARHVQESRLTDIAVELVLPQHPAPVFVDAGYLGCALSAAARQAAAPGAGSRASSVILHCTTANDGEHGAAPGRRGPWVRLSLSGPGRGPAPHGAGAQSALAQLQLRRTGDLGLWFVERLARACAGEASVSAEEAGGTTVSLWLPGMANFQ